MLLIAPLQFSIALRRRQPLLHRLLGRTFILCGFASGLGVLAMIFAFPAIGGLVTQIGTSAIIALMFVCLGLAWRFAINRDILYHRIFMMRAYALALSVSSARIFIELAAYAFSITFERAFMPASILGVLMNLAFVEYRIRLHLPMISVRTKLQKFGLLGISR